jgi:hypothetical protein
MLLLNHYNDNKSYEFGVTIVRFHLELLLVHHAHIWGTVLLITHHHHHALSNILLSWLLLSLELLVEVAHPLLAQDLLLLLIPQLDGKTLSVLEVRMSSLVSAKS